MKNFSGVCRGGPLDGQQIAYKRRICEMCIIDPAQPDPPLGGIPSYKTGEYRHVAKQWIWREDGKAREHKERF